MAASSIVNLDALKCVAARYDFAVHGGAVGTIGLRVSLPVGAIVVNAFMNVRTALTSGGSATMSLGIQGAADLVAATAYGSAPWSSTGIKLMIPDFATVADQFIVATTPKELTATIAVAALTAGVIDFYVMYVMNEVA